jgi:hypothetical protein
MQRLCRQWTAEEDERVRSFVAKGASTLRASVALKRSQHAVIARARKIGCPFQTLKATREKWADTPNNLWRGR